MKKQMWLARVAISLVLGMAGVGSLQAAKDYTLDGGSDTISDQEIKTLCVKNSAWLDADKVTVTGGAYAMSGSIIFFHDSDVSGDSLYAGPELVEGVPKQDGSYESIVFDQGKTSVTTLWGYGSDIVMEDHTLRADTVKLEKEGEAAVNGGSFAADSVTLSGASRLDFYGGVTANVTETMEVDDGSTLSMSSYPEAPSLTAQNLMLKNSNLYINGDATLTVKGEMTLDGSYLRTKNPESWVSTEGSPSVTAQKLTIKNRNLISLKNQGTMQVGTLVSDGGVTRIEGDGTLTVEEAILSQTSFQVGPESDDPDPSSIKLTTKKLSLQSGELSIYHGSYEMQGEENVFGEDASIWVDVGGQFSMADGAAIHAKADSENNLQTVIQSVAGADVDVSKGTLYVSNAKTDGTVYDVSTAVKENDVAVGNFKTVYGVSRRVISTALGDGKYTFASYISEIAKDSAIPNILTAADASSGALKDFIDKAFGEGMTDAEGHNAFEREVSMAGMLGVTHGTYSFAEDMSGLIADHAGKERGIWATYVHRDRGVDGFSAIGRKAKYDMKYNGILLGGDFRTRENARTGLAFMYADGSHTRKDGVSGKADTKYYGLDVYHHFQAGGVSYKADIGYIKGDYDLEQTQLGMTVKGDVGGNAFFAGIRAEKDFACGTGKVTPYAGLRYYRVHTGDFTDSLGLKHETGTANIWSLPLGVEFRHESKNGAWTVSPVAELGYRFILGGKDTNETMHYNTASNSYRIDVAENSFLARLGIEAESPAWSLGGGYRYQKGSNSRANEWYLQVGYRF